jgi:hypothetical protein
MQASRSACPPIMTGVLFEPASAETERAARVVMIATALKRMAFILVLRPTSTYFAQGIEIIDAGHWTSSGDNFILSKSSRLGDQRQIK